MGGGDKFSRRKKRTEQVVSSFKDFNFRAAVQDVLQRGDDAIQEAEMSLRYNDVERAMNELRLARQEYDHVQRTATGCSPRTEHNLSTCARLSLSRIRELERITNDRLYETAQEKRDGMHHSPAKSSTPSVRTPCDSPRASAHGHSSTLSLQMLPAFMEESDWTSNDFHVRPNWSVPMPSEHERVRKMVRRMRQGKMGKSVYEEQVKKAHVESKQVAANMTANSSKVKSQSSSLLRCFPLRGQSEPVVAAAADTEEESKEDDNFVHAEERKEPPRWAVPHRPSTSSSPMRRINFFDLLASPAASSPVATGTRAIPSTPVKSRGSGGRNAGGGEKRYVRACHLLPQGD
ncbi:hypothetical protein GUITHDRAFT_122015 [Guillardia theta CCMP2712]|uniref:Uncharacterized protein n=1 Tax=Guillardia theta (strain CCMP2712) TaxID=905079 RepID=L1I6W4_GUITC|nr:hypothetical protein GUITHDRAFT_122015 [Guillardia theta CCMP2712]EKX31792.1 hypothetical protein GUITHDRAFT_122015 [Guillardia theta CCMP2712]|eukprot:XP_005818772.1 hypothetical protein GUITHDRAFT_122015 [Guillardia theta CCMP2712]